MESPLKAAYYDVSNPMKRDDSIISYVFLRTLSRVSRNIGFKLKSLSSRAFAQLDVLCRITFYRHILRVFHLLNFVKNFRDLI